MTEEQELSELLARHADALVRGRDDREPLLDSYTGLADRQAVETLLWLGSELARALAPVEPRPEFVNSLGQSLETMLPPAAEDRRRMAWFVAAASATSVASVAALYYWRRSRSRAGLETSASGVEIRPVQPVIIRNPRTWTFSWRGK